MGQSLSGGASMHRKDSLESSSLSRQTSVRTCDSYLSSRASVMESRRVLDMNNKFFVCSNFVMEDPCGYSSKVYYRSHVNVGEGVPFQWETQPGKRKTDHVHHGVKALPLSSPPSFNSPGGQKMYNENKQIRRKSRKILGPCVGCNPFNVRRFDHIPYGS